MALQIFIKKPFYPLHHLPIQLKPFLELFKDSNEKSFLRIENDEFDYRIEIIKDENEVEQKLMYNPLCGLSREELLAILKSLTGLFDREFIRMSRSPTASSILFAKKPR